MYSIIRFLHVNVRYDFVGNITTVIFILLFSCFCIISFSALAASEGNSDLKLGGKAQVISSSLSLNKAIHLAQQYDPWVTGNKHQQKAIELMSQAQATLPDPKVSITVANLPTNGFDFSQEAMTQAKFGIAQLFPRGDSLALMSQKLKIESEAYSYQRQDRAAQVAVIVGTLWLDIYQIQQSRALIEKNRSLFEQLADIAQASYSSAIGKTRQQDIVRAQLELTRLEDRLNILTQQQDNYLGMLMPWLIEWHEDHLATTLATLSDEFSKQDFTLSDELPSIALFSDKQFNTHSPLQTDKLIHYFEQHPAVVALDKNISATQTSIKLAKQKYQPEWGVNASYGYRANDAMGQSRADLFSVGVTFDLPLFTENKQDKEVQSVIAKSQAVKTDKILLLRKLLSTFTSAQGRLSRLKDRQHLYQTKLLPQMHDQAEASLTAYTHDDGDFAEVVRSRISVLNGEIEHLTLNVQEQKLHLEINYLFAGSIHHLAFKQFSNPEFNETKTMQVTQHSKVSFGENL